MLAGERSAQPEDVPLHGPDGAEQHMADVRRGEDPQIQADQDQDAEGRGTIQPYQG